MYIPSHFRIDDPASIREFIQGNAFATVVTHSEGSAFASHLPVLVGNPEGAPSHFLAHMARANPQWHHFVNGEEVLLIFHGPHAYISPFWYEAEEAVPTWNYAVVHAYGRASVIEDTARLKQMVEILTRTYEGTQADTLFSRWSEEFVTRMLKGIVGFEVQVTRLEAKFKLGQNRVAADTRKVFEALTHSSDPYDNALAKLMKDQGVVAE